MNATTTALQIMLSNDPFWHRQVMVSAKEHFLGAFDDLSTRTQSVVAHRRFTAHLKATLEGIVERRASSYASVPASTDKTDLRATAQAERMLFALMSTTFVAHAFARIEWEVLANFFLQQVEGYEVIDVVVEEG